MRNEAMLGRFDQTMEVRRPNENILPRSPPSELALSHPNPLRAGIRPDNGRGSKKVPASLGARWICAGASWKYDGKGEISGSSFLGLGVSRGD